MMPDAPTSYRAQLAPVWLVCTGADGAVLYDRTLSADALLLTGAVNHDRNPFGPARPEAVRAGEGVPLCILGAGPLGHLPAGGPHVTDAWAGDELLWSHDCAGGKP